MRTTRFLATIASLLFIASSALAKVDAVIITDLGGHESTAAGIEYELDQLGLTHKRIYVSEFMPPSDGDESDSAYLRMFANQPEVLNRASDFQVWKAKRTAKLIDLNYTRQWYQLDNYVRVMRREQPSVVFDTSYQPSEIMEEAHLKGLVRDLPASYVQTDTGRNDYLARLVPAADVFAKVFAPNRPYIDTALGFGVQSNKLVESGMPISPAVRKVLSPDEISSLRASLGLTEGVPTIFLGGGSFGLGKFDVMLDSVAKAFGTRDVQVVVGTGRNKKAPEMVAQLASKLPKNIKVATLGYTPDMAMYQKYLADVVITKAGGLTTTELTYMRKNMVLIGPAVNYERANLRYFVGRGLALTAKLEGIGEQARRFIDDKEFTASVRRAQDREMANYHPEKLGKWALRMVERQHANEIPQPTFASDEEIEKVMNPGPKELSRKERLEARKELIRKRTPKPLSCKDLLKP